MVNSIFDKEGKAYKIEKVTNQKVVAKEYCWDGNTFVTGKATTFELSDVPLNRLNAEQIKAKYKKCITNE